MPHGIYQRRVRDTSTSFFLKVVLIYVRLIHVVRYVHYKVKVKVKFTLEQATKAQRGSRVILYSFFNLDARWGWVVNATARLLYPRERRGTHCTYRRLGGPQGRSGQIRKISPPPGFDPQTFQPLASRYTVYAIPMCTMSLSLNTPMAKSEWLYILAYTTWGSRF